MLPCESGSVGQPELLPILSELGIPFTQVAPTGGGHLVVSLEDSHIKAHRIQRRSLHLVVGARAHRCRPPER